MESHRVKTVNTDKRSRKRLKFASAREKSKYATADIYRSYKRKLGTTSSSTSQREEAVHSNNNKLKRQKRISSTSSSSKSSTTTITSTTNDGRTSIVRSSSRKTKDKKEEEDAAEYDTIDDNNNLMETSLSSTTTTTTFFSDELDIAFDRNGSEIFQQFHRQIWKLCRSLPEILHHSNEIVDILLSYMLSPYDAPGTPTPITADGTSTSSSKENDTTKDDDDKKKTKSSSSSSSSSYSINHATMDILHLISVLARDLRHEIHPYVHTKIVPRIIYDMLNSPPPSATSATSTSKSSRSQQQQKGEGEDQTETQKQQQRQVIPLDITIVEAAFRTISYLFKYDTTTTSTIASTKAAAAAASKEHQQEEEKGNDATNIMEIMRKYYGPTLVHRRDIVRHLASETFAPVIRNMKSDTSRQRHLKRVLRALVMSSTSTTSTTSPVSSSTTMSKTQVDAIDGISKLIFQIIKGVRGKLHSKGIQTIRFLLEFLTQDKSVLVLDTTGSGNKDNNNNNNNNKNNNTAGHDMIYKVVSVVLYQTCRHIDHGNFVILFNEILDVLDKNIITKLFPSSNNADSPNGSAKKEKTKSTKNSSSSSSSAASDAAVVPLLDMMKLLAQTLSSSSHVDTLTHKSNENNINQLLNILEILCKKHMISTIQSKSNNNNQGNEDQGATLLSLFCDIWVSIHRVPKFDTYLQGFVSSILDTEMGNIKKKENARVEYEGIQKRALNLSQNLLPYLPQDMAAKSVATCLLSTAAKIVEYDTDASLHIVFTVASMRLQRGSSSASDSTNDEDEHDDLFFPENGAMCCISGPEKDALLKACLLNSDLDQLTRDGINKLGLALRCIPFIATIRQTKEDSKKALSYFKRMSKWIVGVLDGIPSCISKENENIKPIDLTIVTALALESLSRLALTVSGAMKDVSTVEKTLKRTILIAEKFLFSARDSIWAVKSVAAFIEALQAYKIPFSDNANQVFDGLAGNLRSSSHFLRMRTLQILASYPTKPFVTDHADLDLDGDLDEEPSATPGRDQVRSGPTGPCDILETLLQLESVPITLANERQLLSLVSRVEVLGRTGKLPVAYAEAAANHMIGMLHVKFSPLWAASARALGALAIGHEDSVWPTLEAQLAAVIERPPDQGLNEEVHSDTEQSSLDQHQLCINWETSVGMDSTLFRNNVSPEVEGKVSRYHATDGETVMESVWRVLEDNPQLLAKHSRVLVPVFIRFLHCQYYFFHSSDPDARELSLHEHVVGPLR